MMNLELVKNFISDEFVINFSSKLKVEANNLDCFSGRVIELIDKAKEKQISQVVIIDDKVLREPDSEKEVLVVKDHINLTTQNPLLGPNDESKGQRFFAVNDLYLIPESLSTLQKSISVGINPGSVPTQEERNILGTQNGTDCCFTYNFVQAALIAAHRNLKVCGLIFG